MSGAPSALVTSDSLWLIPNRRGIEERVFAHVFATLHSMRIIGEPNEFSLHRVTQSCSVLQQKMPDRRKRP